MIKKQCFHEIRKKEIWLAMPNIFLLNKYLPQPARFHSAMNYVPLAHRPVKMEHLMLTYPNVQPVICWTSSLAMSCEGQSQCAIFLPNTPGYSSLDEADAKCWSSLFFWLNHDTIHRTSLGIIHRFLSVWELTTKTFFITKSHGKRKERKQTRDVRKR